MVFGCTSELSELIFSAFYGMEIGKDVGTLPVPNAKHGSNATLSTSWLLGGFRRRPN